MRGKRQDLRTERLRFPMVPASCPFGLSPDFGSALCALVPKTQPVSRCPATFSVDGEPPDRDGLELPDLDVARSEAVRAAGDMLRDIDGEFDGEAWAMRVTEDDCPVLTLQFRAIEHAAD
jgi:hypothetical protein